MNKILLGIISLIPIVVLAAVIVIPLIAFFAYIVISDLRETRRKK